MTTSTQPESPANTPLFRTAAGKTKKLTPKAMNGKDIFYMVKRRFREAGIPQKYCEKACKAALKGCLGIVKAIDKCGVVFLKSAGKVAAPICKGAGAQT